MFASSFFFHLAFFYFLVEKKKLVYLRACGSLKRCGTLITKTILLSQCRQRFSRGEGESRTKETGGGCGSPCLCELTQSAQPAISEPVRPSTAIPKDSFISPFQISVALMVSKIHTALIVCHFVLLFMVTINHLLSAHWEHEFPEKQTCCIHLRNLSTLQSFGYIYWWGGGFGTLHEMKALEGQHIFVFPQIKSLPLLPTALGLGLSKLV